MKSSIFVAASSAMLAMAGPMLKERAMETDWVVEVVTVTVTAGDEQPTAAVFVESANTAPPPPASFTPAPAPAPEPKPEPKPKVQKPKPKPSPPPPPPPEPTTEEPAPIVTVISPPKTNPGSGSGNGGSSDGSYSGVMVEAHNVHRRNHSSGDIQWDDELANWAQNTADSCVFLHDMDQGTGGYGQNLASWGTSGDIGSKNKAGQMGVHNQWYDGEMSNWNFYGASNPPSSSPLDEWGHFTQVVWKGSKKVGCATKLCPAGTLFGFESWFTVCDYSPAGNFGGEYGTNVLKPQGAAMVSA